MRGKGRKLIDEVSTQVLGGLALAAVLAVIAAAATLGALGAIAAVLIIVVGFLALYFGAYEKLTAWRDYRRFRKVAPTIVTEMLSYMTHLRDMQKTFSRARGDQPEEVRGRIRREVLEPVRGFLHIPPGGEIKVIWFRPDSDSKHLYMYEHVGHTEEGAQALRLRIGGSAAGKAYVDEETFYSGDCRNDAAFQTVDRSKATGSLACLPIWRGTDVTGVLSVLATWNNAFWHPEISYFETLASAIGALEPLEKGGNKADTEK